MNQPNSTILFRSCPSYKTQVTWLERAELMVTQERFTWPLEIIHSPSDASRNNQRELRSVICLGHLRQIYSDKKDAKYPPRERKVYQGILSTYKSLLKYFFFPKLNLVNKNNIIKSMFLLKPHQDIFYSDLSKNILIPNDLTKVGKKSEEMSNNSVSFLIIAL